MIDTADRLAIHELIGLYGIVIDERDWSRVDELFTDDVLYDMSELGLGVLQGKDAVLQLWRDRDDLHPLAHHATNIVVSAEADGNSPQVISKGLGVGRKGRVGSVTYRDLVRRTAVGWRIARRHARLRQAADSATGAAGTSPRPIISPASAK
ncbi:MAG: nuclear transport factor 2 family protein [Gammaproteobacteria bacterium]|nr:nuclear transport factor 2 family protein [Gammaproteobacteria bacterium]MBM4224046.1 nuclear transport factor 2 family protein [Gammaproteobacteria bacterium]MBM4230612.1 nuclear transport factor 2 family protein [Gammaproteobacteria bacterium]